MKSTNSKVENDPNEWREPKGLMADAVDPAELEIYSEFFHDLGSAIDADECNRFIEAVSVQVKQGSLNGLRFLLTVHKTFVITTERFDLTDLQERELVSLLLNCAAAPDDEPTSFEPTLLDDEHVEFALLVADAVFHTGRIVERVKSDHERRLQKTNAGNPPGE